MNKLKSIKFITLCLTFVMAFFLTSCAGSGDSVAVNSSEKTDTNIKNSDTGDTNIEDTTPISFDPDQPALEQSENTDAIATSVHENLPSAILINKEKSIINPGEKTLDLALSDEKACLESSDCATAHKINLPSNTWTEFTDFNYTNYNFDRNPKDTNYGNYFYKLDNAEVKTFRMSSIELYGSTTLPSNKNYTPVKFVSALDNKEKLILLGGNNENEYSNQSYKSVDGINFEPWFDEKHTYIGREKAQALVFKGKIWLAGGVENKFLESREEVLLNDFYISADGKAWEKKEFSQFKNLYGFKLVKFQDKLWLIGGYTLIPSDDVFSGSTKQYNTSIWSYDGQTWQEEKDADFGARFNHELVVFNNELWMLGGTIDDNSKPVWKFDGTNWSEVAEANAAFPKTSKSSFKTLVFNKKLWLFDNNAGAFDEDIEFELPKSNIYTFDGTNWQTLDIFTDVAGYAPIVFNNKIWLFGGYKLTIWGDWVEYINFRMLSKDGSEWFKGVEFNTYFK